MSRAFKRSKVVVVLVAVMYHRHLLLKKESRTRLHVDMLQVGFVVATTGRPAAVVCWQAVVCPPNRRRDVFLCRHYG